MNTITKGFVCIVLLFGLANSLQGQSAPSKKKHDIQSTMMVLNQLIQLTHNKGLMSELEILDDQAAKVKKIGREYQNQLMEINKRNVKFYTELAELRSRAIKGDEEAKAQADELTKNYYVQMRESQSKTIDQLNEVLLPHQMKRLQQISKQQSFKWARNSDYFGMPYAMSRELKMNSDQRKELKKITEEVREEFYRDVAKMRKKSMKKILSKMTDEQRKRFDELVGDFYDMEKARHGRRGEERNSRQKRDN